MTRRSSPWATLLDTPGMSTDSDEFKALLTGKSMPIYQPSHFPSLVAGAISPVAGVRPTFITIDDHEEDTMNNEMAAPSALLDAELADLAQELTEHFEKTQVQSKTFMQVTACALVGPDTLTVSTSKGYRKRTHVGGEEFRPRRAYVGKRGKLLIEFAPLQADDYEHMEMSAQDALAKLSGFDLLSNFGDDASLADRLRGISRKASVVREQESNESRFDDYKDLGFGTF